MSHTLKNGSEIQKYLTEAERKSTDLSGLFDYIAIANMRSLTESYWREKIAGEIEALDWVDLADYFGGANPLGSAFQLRDQILDAIAIARGNR